MQQKRSERSNYYFSFRSPYSWLAHRELVGAHVDVAASVRWIPFWEPDELTGRALAEAGGQVVYAQMSREKHLYVLQDVRRLAAARGVAFRWPNDREPHWEVPHLAYLAAAEQGQAADFAWRVYRARWEEGRDICDRDVIAAIADEAGLDPHQAFGAVDDPDLRARGVQALLDAHEDRVFGVPFFVRGFDQFWGLDRLEPFADAVRVAAPGGVRMKELVPQAGPAADIGHAGGCG